MIKGLHGVLLVLPILPLSFFLCVGNFCSSSVGCLLPHYTCTWCFLTSQFLFSFQPHPVFDLLLPCGRLGGWFTPDFHLMSVQFILCGVIFFIFRFCLSVFMDLQLGALKLSCLLSCHTEVAVGIQFKGSMACICSVVVLGKVLKVWSDGSVLGFINVCLFMCSVIKWRDPSSEELRAIIDYAVGYKLFSLRSCFFKLTRALLSHGVSC